VDKLQKRLTSTPILALPSGTEGFVDKLQNGRVTACASR